MITGLLAGVFFALNTAVLGMAMTLPVFNSDASVIILAPYVSNFFNAAFSALCLAAYLIKKNLYRKTFRMIMTRKARTVLFSALLGGPFGTTAYAIAIHYIGPSLASAISAAFPALGALLAHLFFNEQIAKSQTIGLLVSVFAVITLSFEPGLNDAKNIPLGIAAACACCLSWAMETILFSNGYTQSGMMQEQVLLVKQCLSAVVCGIIVLPLLHGWKHAFNVVFDKAIFYILAGSFFLTVSFLFYYRSILKIGATKAMALNITYTAWVIPFSFLLLDAVPDLKRLICSALIVGGSLITSNTGRINAPTSRRGKLYEKEL